MSQVVIDAIDPKILKYLITNAAHALSGNRPQMRHFGSG